MTDTAASAPPAPPPFSEYDDQKTQAMEASMIARGESTVEAVPVDYFGLTEEHKVTLPDGVQWIMHRTLTEGDRRKYLQKTNRDVKLQRATGDAYMKIATGEERAALLTSAIINWNLFQHGKQFPFNKQNIMTVLDQFPPTIIDLVHKDIMKHNPWLLGEMTIEDIDREIETLQEQRQRLVEEQAGKESS